MHRFFIETEITGDEVSICDGKQLHHLRDVLRLRRGDEVTLVDKTGTELLCRIAALRADGALLAVEARKAPAGKIAKFTIACAIPKKTSMDDVVDNLTQLGVDSIIPMETERVVVKLDDEKRRARLERWRKIARSAAKQSQRNTVPLVAPVTSFADVVSGSGAFDLKLIPTLAGERKTIKQVLAGARPTGVLVLIGPEGDFTPEEVEMAMGAGFTPVSLGSSVLRVAAAAVAVAAYIRFSLDL